MVETQRDPKLAEKSEIIMSPTIQYQMEEDKINEQIQESTDIDAIMQ